MHMMYLQPDRLRLDGNSPTRGTALMVLNGAALFADVPRFNIHITQNLEKTPSRRQSTLELEGILSPDTLSYLTGTGFFNAGENFALTVAYAGSASDAAYLYDSTSASDSFLGQATASYMVGASYESEAIGFQVVYAYSNGNGSAALDAAPGTNTVKATKNTATLTDPSGLISVEGFASVTATSNSGSDTQDLIGALDFYYDSIGTWTTNKS